jgi:haloacetate dehalogenase
MFPVGGMTHGDNLTEAESAGQKDRFGQLLIAHTGKIAPLDKKTFTLELAERFGPVLDALGKPSNNVPFMMPARIASTPAEVAPFLARSFTVICADLRGYGRSGCPASGPDHAPYAKRAMAKDMVSVMGKLGFPRFSVAGHDRGGRVAYRLALDHPDRVERLTVLDILPTEDTWERADKKLATAFWPWSLLAQPEPLPERLVSSAPDAVVDNALGDWGSPANAFGSEVRAAYIEALRDPARVHAICEEYRAAATLDHEHDLEDRQAGRRIVCPVLVLWSGRGPLSIWCAEVGGPLALWLGKRCP